MICYIVFNERNDQMMCMQGSTLKISWNHWFCLYPHPSLVLMLWLFGTKAYMYRSWWLNSSNADALIVKNLTNRFHTAARPWWASLLKASGCWSRLLFSQLPTLELWNMIGGFYCREHNDYSWKMLLYCLVFEKSK